MNKYLSSAELKRNAKSKLSGNMGTVFGAFLVHMLIMTFLTYTIRGVMISSLVGILIYTATGVVISLVSQVFLLGENYIAMELVCDQGATVTDLFYGFKGQLKKVCSIFIIPSLITNLLFVPIIMAVFSLNSFIENNEIMKEFATMQDINAMYAFMEQHDMDEIMALYEQILPYYFLILGCGILYLLVKVVLQILYSQVLFLMIDYPTKSSTEITRQAFSLIKNSWGRYFYILCSFIFWDLLSMVSFGIVLLWVYPYKRLTYAEFYMDIVRREYENAKENTFVKY